MARELEIRLRPKQSEIWRRWDEEKYTRIGFGGARGGAKSGGGRRLMLVRRMQYPRTTALILRRTFPELYKSHIVKLFEEYPEIRSWWRESSKELICPNGSRLFFGSAETERDLSGYYSSEFADIMVDEAQEFSQNELERLSAPNRCTSNSQITPAMLFTFMPGVSETGLPPKGLEYLKRVLVDNQQRGEETKQRWTFVHALPYDNVEWSRKALEADGLSESEYYSWSSEDSREYFLTRADFGAVLSAITDKALREAWLDGRWDVFKQCIEETIMPGIEMPGNERRPEIRSSQTTEYDPDGRILSISRGSADGPKWVTTNIYDDNGRLTKTISGNGTESGTETLYAYDEAGRLLSITKEGGSKSEFHYDEQGRKTAVRHPDPETVKQPVMHSGFPWDPTVEGGVLVPAGGNITTIYDGNDQPTEAQIRDGEGRLVSRFVRTYDTNGRILEEKHIRENPFLLFADKLAEKEPRFNELNAAQLEGMNTAMKLMLDGPNGAGGITYAYDAQGRVSEMRNRNAWFDMVTTISYNEQGDQIAQRETMTPADSVVTSCSMGPDGTIIPERHATGPNESPALPRANEVQYEYEYDSYGNWTQQTENPERPYHVHVRHRELTYF